MKHGVCQLNINIKLVALIFGSFQYSIETVGVQVAPNQ